MRPSRSMRGECAVAVPARRCCSILPSAMTMSASDEPVAIGRRAGAPRRAQPARVALREHDSAPSSGMAAKPFAHSILPLHRALVPVPQQQMRDEAGQRRRSRCRSARAGPAPRTGAGCSAGTAPRSGGRRGRTPAPAVPAANSATTAAISARPPAIRGRRGNRAGRSAAADGSSVCQRRRAVELEQVEEIVVGRVQALRRVGQDREEGDDPGADQQRLLSWSSRR